MSVGTKIGIAFALGLLLLGAVGGSAYVSTQHLLEANRLVIHTHEVQEKLEDVLSAHLDAETGQRGFIITGEERYLAPYNAGIRRAQQDIDTLASLTRDNASQQESLQQVRKLSDAKLAELRETIRLRRESGLKGALPVILTGRCKKIMDDLRGVVGQMKAREQTLLNEQTAAAQAVASHVIWTIAVWIPLALVVLAVAAIVLVRTVRFGGPAPWPSTAGQAWAGIAIRYGFAVISVAVAAVLWQRLAESFGPLPVFITFYPAVLLVASLAGGGPGIVTAVLSALAADYWFLPPYGAFSIDAPNDVLALGIFTGSNLFLCFVAERLRRARWAEALSVAQQERAEELSRQNEELTQQSEELSQQAEELSQQSEELSRQNEEMQTQSEEILALNYELVHREDLLQALLDAARLAGSEQVAMQEICAATLRMFSEAAAAVIVCEKQGDRLMIRASSGLGEAGAVPESLPAEHSFAELVVQQNRTASLNDVSLRPDLSILQIPGLGPFQAELAAPMQRAGRAFGAVVIYSGKRQEWTAEQFRLAEWLATQCAQTLEALRMQQELARVASFPTLNPNPIVEADSDGRVSYTNPAAQRLFPDIEQRGADHPWLANWPAVAEACRTGAGLSGREVAVDDRFYYQTIHFTPQTGRIRTYGLDVTERKRAEEVVAKDRNLLRALIDNLPDCVYVKDAQSRFLAANRAIARLMGVATPNDLLGKSDADFYPPELAAQYLADEEELLRAGQPLSDKDEPHWDANGNLLDVLTTKVPIRDGQGKIVGLVGITRDITAHKRAQQEREVAIEFLHLVNESRGTPDLIQAAATFFKEQSGCEAVGIRMKEGDDYPYFEARGFPAEFVRLENNLCSRDSNGAVVRDSAGNPLIECMCGNVICGRFDPSKPFFTAHGSFWTNCTTELLASTTEADRQARTRNRCNGEGYESVALLPLHVGEERLGLLQLNDRRKGMFTPAAIGLWERLAGYLAVALAKFRAEDEVYRLNANLEQLVAEQTGEIRKAGAYNRILIESSLDPLVTIGPDGKITDVSAATEQATGFDRQDLIGKDFANYFTDPEKAHAGYQRVFQEGLVRDYPLEIRHRNGHTIPVLYNAAVYRDETGQVVGVFAAARDITELKRAEAALKEANRTLEQRVAERTAKLSDSEARFRRLVEQVPIPLCLVNQEGVLVYFNDRFVQTFGYTRDDVPTLTEWWRLAYPDDEYRRWVVATWEAAVRRAAEEKTDIRPLEYNVTCKDGTVRVVEISGITTEENFLATFIDLTERKRAEETLLEAKAAAEAANEAKSQFLANMSHELRTPMNAILGMIDVALPKAADPTVLDCLQAAKGSADLLLTLLDDLLDSAKIESGKLELEAAPFSLRQMLDQIARVLSVRASEKGLCFSCPTAEGTPDALVGDRMRLQQVLLNLAGNAIKFTERGNIEIGVRVVEKAEEGIRDWGLGIREGESEVAGGLSASNPQSLIPNPSVSLEFAVRDTGIGIPPLDLERLFQPFAQADASMARRFGGTGLGLSICKRLVELMGGRIRVESEEGKGSTFSFNVRLPLATELPSDFDAPVLVPAAACAPLRILLVEDNPANQKLATYILQDRGHVVEIAEDGQEAIDLTEQDRYDVILMDVQMPGMDGLEATAAIRRREAERGLGIRDWGLEKDSPPATSDSPSLIPNPQSLIPSYRLPIIAMTAHAMKGDRDRCLAAGMDGYLAKPIDAREMIALVERLAAGSPSAGLGTVWPSPNRKERADLPSAAVFDAGLALKRCLGKHDLLARMIGFFFDDVDKLLPQVRSALQRGDLTEVGKLGHRLKGTIAHLAAQPAREAAARVENVGLCGGAQAEAEEAVRMLERECAALRAALSAQQAAGAPLQHD